MNQFTHDEDFYIIIAIISNKMIMQTSKFPRYAAINLQCFELFTTQLQLAFVL